MHDLHYEPSASHKTFIFVCGWVHETSCRPIQASAKQLLAVLLMFGAPILQNCPVSLVLLAALKLLPAKKN
jgi:hypothetical protein